MRLVEPIVAVVAPVAAAANTRRSVNGNNVVVCDFFLLDKSLEVATCINATLFFSFVYCEDTFFFTKRTRRKGKQKQRIECPAQM